MGIISIIETIAAKKILTSKSLALIKSLNRSNYAVVAHFSYYDGKMSGKRPFSVAAVFPNVVGKNISLSWLEYFSTLARITPVVFLTDGKDNTS